MNPEEFKEYGYQFVDWIAQYLDNIENYPVKSPVKPKEVYDQIPDRIPSKGESMDTIFEDFQKVILPGITHWQSPNFFAYFPANSSPPSVLAEMLTAAMGVQGMKWDTSPASTELEEKVMEWLRDAIGLPKEWTGVIHDTASTATLAAIISAREQISSFSINQNGYRGYTNFRVYCSSETHSSIEKGAKIAGIGKEHVMKIDTDDILQMRPDLLEEQIQSDIQAGYRPLCIVAALGTTSTLAFDPLDQIGKVAQQYNIWLHIDAAYAGSAFLLPEYQYLLKGIEGADSFVFNPHKWLMTNFDCTAYFVKDPSHLVNTFSILPEYLKSVSDAEVNNHSDWGIPLGRRFRSLKLWFVLRYYGLTGLREKLRRDIQIAEWLESQVKESPSFELVVPRKMNLVCFRYLPKGVEDISLINQVNSELVSQLNASGRMYLTHTKVGGKYTIRLSIGQTNVQHKHVENAWEFIQRTAFSLQLGL